HFLSKLYLEQLKTKEIEKKGIIYTPVEVARLLAETVLHPFNKGKKDLIALDPCCGTGVILIELFRAILALWPQQRQRDLYFRKGLLQSSIWGIDIDKTASEICRILLCIECIKTTPPSLISKRFLTELILSFKDNIAIGNPLLFSASSLANKTSPLALILNKRFDCVVTNPPYGISRENKISKNELIKLKKIYKKYKFGNVNKYMVFMALGEKLLSSCGSLVMIVPNSWLGIKAGQKLRELWLKEKHLWKVIRCPQNTFKDIGVEPVIFAYFKGRKHKTLKVETVSTFNNSATSLIKINQNLLLKLPAFTIPTFWLKGTETLVKKIIKNSVSLLNIGLPLKPCIALQEYLEGHGNPVQTKETVKARPFH
ncbi:MAG: hypothetical protein D6780_03420, partial [Candidatus Dadabacteria bacterium]